MTHTNKVIGITRGIFDLFHIGHLNLLRNAKQHCDELIVFVGGDKKTKNEKGKTPIIPEDERVEIVKSIRFVDKVVLEKEYDIEGDYHKYGFSKIFKGDDWKKKNKWHPKTEKFLSKYDVEIIFFPYTQNISSTLLKEKINKLGKEKS